MLGKQQWDYRVTLVCFILYSAQRDRSPKLWYYFRSLETQCKWTLAHIHAQSTVLDFKVRGLLLSEHETTFGVVDVVFGSCASVVHVMFSLECSLPVWIGESPETSVLAQDLNTCPGNLADASSFYFFLFFSSLNFSVLLSEINVMSVQVLPFKKVKEICGNVQAGEFWLLMWWEVFFKIWCMNMRFINWLSSLNLLMFADKYETVRAV